jgi:hypothetical protein
MFWRMTAQRLLVERGNRDVVPALVRLASDHSVDELGLNPGALHALWTLHGLGAIPSDPTAVAAARGALTHPAASLRRAALMILPRDQRLVDDIFAAGILPDRTSPWRVDYTVATSILQDADAHVRLEALLVLSEVAGSPRAAAALADVITAAENARDPWIPDGVAIAGVKQGAEFLQDIVRRRVPANDTLAAAGMRRAVSRMARAHAVRADVPAVVSLISGVPQANQALAIAMLEGIAQGWPQETPPQLTADQRTALATAARGASPELTAAFDRVAARWTLPDVFKSSP